MKKLEPTLLVKVKQSQGLLMFLVLLHIVSALSVFMMASVLWLKLLLWGFIVASGYFYWHRYEKNYYCFTLKYSTEFLWQLIYNDKKPVSFVVLKSTVITSFLVVLHVKIARDYRYFLVLADSTDDESFRKLHVFLKIKAQDQDT